MSNYSRRSILVLSLSSLLTGCMVGPNFHSPDAPHTDSYIGTPLPKKTTHANTQNSSGKTQYFISSNDVPGEWWSLFHSPELNTLIQKGIANSPNLEAAQAALKAAHEATVAQIGSSLYPNLSLGLGGQRERFSNASFGGSTGSGSSVFNLFNANVNVTYTLDAFGGARRQIETLSAQEDNARYELAASYLTLTANIVTTAITIASLEAQIQATQELIAAQADQLKIVKKQLHVGGTAESDVLSQQTQLAQTQATLPPLQQNLAQNLHLLSILIGETPNENQLPRFKLDKLTLPAYLPVTLPSDLVRQRPDILAAEANLHAACAQIGVATANLYPQLTLTGSYGREGPILSNLMSPNNLVWNYGGSLTQPIFNGGSLRAKKRQAVDLFQQSAAQYRQTVLVAFQNVADTLRALQHDAEALNIQTTAVKSAQKSLRITTQQYHDGGTNYLSLLTAQRQYQQTRLAYIQAQAARYADTAALFQALGGGWWHKKIEGTDHATS